MKFFKLIPLLTFIIFGHSHLSAATTTFSYCNQQDALQTWGNSKPETIDIAVFINDPALVGKKITSIFVPFNGTDATDCSLWLSSKLVLASKKNAPDICQLTTTPDGKYLKADLTSPYTITSDGVYAGYSFTIASATNKAVVVEKNVPQAFWVHTSRTQLSWKDLSTSAGVCSAIGISVEGDFPATALEILQIGDSFELAGTDFAAPVEIRNLSCFPITGIEYTITYNNTITPYSWTDSAPLAPGFLENATVYFPIGKYSNIGDNEYTLEITKVNGETPSVSARATGHAHAATSMADYRPLFEEYTGINCGYCTRGLAALDRMYKLYPDKFVGISYHRDDVTQVSKVFPTPTQNFALPTGFMNRQSECDPYFGPSGTEGFFPFENYWKETCNQKAEMNISVAGSWDDESHTVINAVANVTFLRKPSKNYRLAYVLVADGLQDASWIQSNYYSGENANLFIEEMRQFCEGPSHFIGYVYNDVGVMFSDMSGEAGSIPDNAPINTPLQHIFKFDTSKAVSLENVNLIPDKTKLRVVAIVVDEQNVACNCNIASVENVGIQTPDVSAEIVKSKFFDLNGTLVNNPEKGVFIRINQFENGSCSSPEKIILK